MKRKRNEWVARAVHHAPKLKRVAKVASKIISEGIYDHKITTRGIHLFTRNGRYVVRGCDVRGERYAGIEVRHRGKQLAFVKVEDC